MATKKTEAPAQTTADALLATIEALKAENERIAALLPTRDENPFLRLFPVANVVFKHRVGNPGKPWNDGTISTRICDVTIRIGDLDAWIPSCNIVLKKFVTGAQKLELQMPSSSRGGGAIHLPFLDVPRGGYSSAFYDEWQTAIVDRWMSERQAAVAGGAPAIAASMKASGVMVPSDALLVSLGILANPPAPTPPAPAADPTPTTT